MLCERAKLTVGRNPSNDLPIDWDDTVSRLHAALERVGEGWRIEDLGSRSARW